jgi:hypothetical protein
MILRRRGQGVEVPESGQDWNTYFKANSQQITSIPLIPFLLHPGGKGDSSKKHRNGRYGPG